MIFLAASPVNAAKDNPFPACACAERPFSARQRDATAIFTGTVTEILPDQEILDAPKGGTWNKRTPQADIPVRVTLAIDKVYKGVAEADKDFILHTSLTEYTCAGHPFEAGKGYLVFAYVQDAKREDRTSIYSFPSGSYEVGGLCGGTKELLDAREDIGQLEALISEPIAAAP